MKKVSIIPILYKSDRVWCDRRHFFQEMIAEKYDWEVTWTDTPDIDDLKTADIVMACSAPSTRNPHTFMSLIDLPKTVRVIAYLEDVHNAEPFDRNMLAFLPRCDLILCERKDLFIKKWPQYKDKLRYLPPYFAPSLRYTDLPYYDRPPKMKCLISGATSGRYYPLRQFVHDGLMANPKLAKIIDILPHPGYGYWDIQKAKEADSKLAINEKYATLLNQYYAGVTSCARSRYALSKYFEIPASGGLLFANSCPDVEDAGLIPGEHFVLVDENNVFELIQDAIDNPNGYKSIRKAGMLYCRENHSVDKRVEQFGEFLKEL